MAIQPAIGSARTLHVPRTSCLPKSYRQIFTSDQQMFDRKDDTDLREPGQEQVDRHHHEDETAFWGTLLPPKSTMKSKLHQPASLFSPAPPPALAPRRAVTSTWLAFWRSAGPWSSEEAPTSRERRFGVGNPWGWVKGKSAVVFSLGSPILRQSRRHQKTSPSATQVQQPVLTHRYLGFCQPVWSNSKVGMLRLSRYTVDFRAMLAFAPCN